MSCKYFPVSFSSEPRPGLYSLPLNNIVPTIQDGPLCKLPLVNVDDVVVVVAVFFSWW